MCIEVGAIHLVLNCLGIFTHHSQMYQLTGIPTTTSTTNTSSSNTTLKPSALADAEPHGVSDDRSHVYWEKGTGFGTGSTSKSWDVEQALLRQKTEEEHVTVFLQVLSSYINPGDRPADATTPADTPSAVVIPHELPAVFFDLLQQSCLIPALSSYLRNDSVLDITRHIPLYRAILQLLRAIALSAQLVSLLLPGAHDQGGSMSIAVLLANMKSCVDTYASRLK